MLSTFKSSWMHFLFLFALLIVLSVGIPAHNVTRERLSFLAFDQYYKAYPRPATDMVKIIDIDDVSLSHLGQWPWPRDVVADLITRLTDMGAAVIAFDGVLAEPDRTSPRLYADDMAQFGYEGIQASQLPDHDEILAKAIQKSGIFVTAFTHGSNERRPRIAQGDQLIRAPKQVKESLLENAKRFSKTALFLEDLENAAAGNGSFMATPEIDGILRKTAIIFSDKQKLYPSLNLEAYRVMQDPKSFIGISTLKPEDGFPNATYKVVVGKKIIPVDDRAEFWVYFRHFDREKDYISAYKVLAPDAEAKLKDKIKGRVLFVGSSAEGLKDLRATPLNPFLPGVEIHANVVEQIMQDRYIFRPSFTVEWENMFILVVGSLMILLAPLVNVAWIGVLCAGSLATIIYGSLATFEKEGLLLDPFYPGISVFIIFVASVFLTYLRTERERRAVRQAFGLYISPDFMKELTSDPDKLRLGGEIRDLSVIFTDIRGFTTISEGLAPEELIQLMNDFLTPMSDLVMQNRGTIDKYMGDAMMAFWNAPLDDPDHARNACRAALGMQQALEPINQRVQARAAELGKVPILLNAGIGINSGPCAVGNMGSKQRFAYSALGDAVNLASRLEGQTKAYDVNILIGESTTKQASDFAFIEVDLIQVKGKTQPVHMFALIGDDAMALQTAFQEWRQEHDAMLKAYRTRDFEGAFKMIKSCELKSGGRLETLYALYSDRCIEMMKNPPPADWNGVYEAKSK